MLPGRIYNSDGFSMRVPLPLEAKRTGGNRPSGKPDIRCQETTIIRDESKKYFPRTLLLNPLLLRTLQLVAVPAVILLAAALAVATSKGFNRSVRGKYFFDSSR